MMNFHTPTENIEIPNKSVFTTDEVCSLTGVKPYVLRFWENEFEEISPMLSSSGKKLFEHKDIEAIIVVKKLLYDEKLSVERAKAELSVRMQPVLPPTPQEIESDDFDFDQEPIPANDAFQYRRWDEEDIKKLSRSKEILRSLLERADSLKDSHHWH